MKEKKQEDLSQFLKEYQKYQDTGVKFLIDGKEESLSKIAKICCVKEKGHYMGDFIDDDSGQVVEIRFDKIIE